MVLGKGIQLVEGMNLQQPQFSLLDKLQIDEQSRKLLERILEEDAHNSRSLFEDLSEHEQTFVVNTLLELSQNQFTSLNTLWEIDYERAVPSVEEFLWSEEYMGNITAPKDDPDVGLYDFWADELKYVLNPDNRVLEVLIQASIGSGKTWCALLAMQYWICKLLCLRSPQKFYGLPATTRIVFFIFSVTLDMAFDRCYTELSKMMQLSPFFQSHLLPTKGKDIISLPKNIAVDIGSQLSQHPGGGSAVIFGLLDEANFGTGAMSRTHGGKINRAPGTEGYNMSRVMMAYNSMLRRMESRFLRAGGVVEGQLFMVSSPSTENAALTKHIEATRKKGIKTSYIIEKPIYEIQKTRRGGRPVTKYSGKTFRVLVGDKYLDSRILSDDEVVPESEDFKVIEVPIEYKESFEKDLEKSLQDIANVSAVPTNKFIRNKEKLKECVEDRRSPFKTELVLLDFDNDEELQDFLDVEFFKNYIRTVQDSDFSIHVDTGLTGDALGLSMTHTGGVIPIETIDVTGRHFTERKLVFTNDFTIRIKNVEGKEVPLFKIVRFILWLKNECGINLFMVSCDGYERTSILQPLTTQGIPNRVLSVDKSDVPYITLKSAIYEGRISLYDYNPLISELLDLLYYSDIKKVDHPEGGRKDCADALCGSVFNLADPTIKGVRSIVEPQPEYTPIFGQLEKELRKRSYQSLRAKNEFEDFDKML
jgi:hypothetical protein